MGGSGDPSLRGVRQNTAEPDSGRDTPGGVLVPLPPWTKGLAPQGETLQGAARRVVAPYGRHGPRAAGGSESRPYNVSGGSQQNRRTGGSEPRTYNVSGGSQQKRTTGARCAPLRRLKEITAEENGILRTSHRQNQQKPPQLFPVLYSNISQKFSFVTIMSQYYGFVTLRPNPLTGGLH